MFMSTIIQFSRMGEKKFVSHNKAADIRASRRIHLFLLEYNGKTFWTWDAEDANKSNPMQAIPPTAMMLIYDLFGDRGAPTSCTMDGEGNMYPNK